MDFQFTADFAAAMDKKDELAAFRQQFHFPQHEGADALYFTGNSLGLQPRGAATIIEEELADWRQYGVEGHLQARRPWLRYHEFFSDSLAALAGANPSEVVAMNGLTTNLHLLMVSFFNPGGKRSKILCEGKAFPSDQYALHSQLRFHGLDPAEHLIEISPDPESELIDDERVLQVIEQRGDEIAMLMMGGVNYYTGQVFDMKRITEAARKKGITVGWDLAHGMGNIELKLHDWGVDFAAWCGYKYLNSGPGGVSGVFIHERHHAKKELNRFEGWWGHDKESRFAMPDRFEPIPTAEAWQLSNAPVFAMAPLLASLQLFEEAGQERLRSKARLLTGYLEYIVDQLRERSGRDLRILTPRDESRRGCQLSVVVPGVGKAWFDKLSARGVIADWREPDVIRMAPVPLYNSFEDIYQFGKIAEACLKEI